MSVDEASSAAAKNSSPREAIVKADERVLLYAVGVAVALLLAYALRAVVDSGPYPFSLRAIALDALQGLPLGVGSVLVSAAFLGNLSTSRGLSRIDALATSSLAVALQQPYASVSGGTAFPVVMIPFQVALIAIALVVVGRGSIAAYPFRRPASS